MDQNEPKISHNLRSALKPKRLLILQFQEPSVPSDLEAIQLRI